MTAPTDLTAWLDELDAARKAATPGPWHWDPKFGEGFDTGLALTNDAQDEIVGAYNHHCCAFRDDPNVDDADAALIVAAVNALPELVAAVRAVLALAEELEGGAAEARASMRALFGAKRPCLAEAHAYRSNAYESAAIRLRAAVAAAHTEEA